jgi:deoxycytidylate deaminase
MVISARRRRAWAGMVLTTAAYPCVRSARHPANRGVGHPAYGTLARHADRETAHSATWRSEVGLKGRVVRPPTDRSTCECDVIER